MVLLKWEKKLQYKKCSYAYCLTNDHLSQNRAGSSPGHELLTETTAVAGEDSSVVMSKWSGGGRLRESDRQGCRGSRPAGHDLVWCQIENNKMKYASNFLRLKPHRKMLKMPPHSES
ncbi:hypothetical protein NDU88_001787 [Pleurodeles waltl]|uniref:Uncharacterized protein n=1 Tax=Pleurodeles waltl TaxID=8319 RepID=A0AAV7LZK0_PLEWA|nr:hypothetical protein NDU88_001787 [Pleurodeles waltl]